MILIHPFIDGKLYPLMHPEVRGQDDHGTGYYLAPRIGRLHKGIDFDCPLGSLMTSMIAGKVTKLGWVYLDPKKKAYRYVQVTDENDLKFRFMYLAPLVKVGDIVNAKQVIGQVQDLTKIYKGITQHCHFEVMKGSHRIDPRRFAFE